MSASDNPATAISSIYNPEYESAKNKEPEVIGDTEKALGYIGGVTRELEGEGIVLSYRVKQFFSLLTRFGTGSFVIRDEKENRVYLAGLEDFGNGGELNAPVGTLYIDDLKSFVLFLQKTEDTIDNSEKTDSQRWVNGQDIYTVWNNATSQDFHNPTLFLGRVINEMQDETLAHINSWEKAADINVNGTGEYVYIKHSSNLRAYEAPHDLNISITDRETPTDTDNLPAVRYGVVEQGKAVIYAVQMPLIHNETESTIQRHFKHIAQYSRDTTGKLLELYRTNRKLYTGLLGDTSVEELKADNDEEYLELGLKIYKRLTENALADGYENYLGWVESQYKKLGINYEQTQMTPFEELGRVAKINDYRETLILLGQRKERLSRFTDEMRAGRTQEFRGAPPLAVISMTAGIAILRKSGINEIMVPLRLPHRQHSETETGTNDRIQSQMFQTIGRIINEVEGVSLISDPEEDGYYHLKIDEHLHSQNPLLQGIIEGIEGFDVEG